MSANSFSDIANPLRRRDTPNKFGPDEKGSITGTLGTGDNAKNSLIYICIKWCFISAAVLSMVVAANDWLFRVNEKAPVITDDLRMVWNIFMPLVTLALGYAFGKSQK